MIPYIFLIRLGSLINASSNHYEYGGSSILAGKIYEFISHPIIQSLAAILLIFSQAVIINNISIKNRLASETSLFAGVAYILLVSVTTPLMILEPIHFANLFLLMAISNAFDTYKNTDAIGNIFATGFFISMAAIFHPPFIVFVFWGFIALIILHSFKWKEKIQYFSGVGVAIYLLYGFIYYFTDGLEAAMTNFYKLFGLFSYKPVDLEGWISISVYSLIFLIVFFSFNNYGQKKRVEVQKKIDVLFWYMVFCIPTIVLTQNININSLLIIAPAMAILIGINMTQMKNKMMMEIIHILILGVIVFTHFFLN